MLRNYLNYSGSKDRIYPTIRKHLKRAVGRNKNKTLVDMFCGSAVVTINSLDLFETLVAVDACEELIRIHTWVRYLPIEDILTDIDIIISNYGLSKDNKEGFLKLRTDYNRLRVEQGIINVPMLYCLITHAYNYMLHTNKSGEFNAPSGAGRSYFNSSLKQKLINCKQHITDVMSSKQKKILIYTTSDYMDMIKRLNTDDFENAVFYADPPYSACISKHPYRVGNIKWTADEDRKLFECLDYIHNNGGKFILSNVTANNGVYNIPLKNWARSYVVNPIEVSYQNSSYQRKNNGKTEEVLITNF